MGTAILALTWLCLSGDASPVHLGIHQGKVVSTENRELVIADELDGDNEAFTVLADAKINLDGKEVELEDLAPGHAVKVTSKQRQGKTVAVVIEARSSE